MKTAALATELAAAFKSDPAGALRAIQVALLAAAEDWAAEDVDILAFDSAEQGIEQLAAAFEGGSGAPRAVTSAPDSRPAGRLWNGRRVVFCGEDCAYHYDERCPGVEHVTTDEDEV